MEVTTRVPARSRGAKTFSIAKVGVTEKPSNADWVRVAGFRLRSGLIALVGLLSGSNALAAAEIVDLLPVVKDGRIFVSFGVQQAFTEDIGREIESGLPVTFRYKIELKRVRRFWMNERLATRLVQVTVTYDNLTKRYSLTRELDGEVDSSEVSMDLQVMQRFMTEFDFLSLFETSLMQEDEEYYLRVNGVMKERNRFLFIPWDLGARWKKAYFTYVP